MATIKGLLGTCRSLKSFDNLLDDAQVGMFKGSRKVDIRTQKYTFNQIIETFFKLSKESAKKASLNTELVQKIANRIEALDTDTSYAKGLKGLALVKLGIRQCFGNFGMKMKYGAKYRTAVRLNELAYQKFSSELKKVVRKNPEPFQAKVREFIEDRKLNKILDVASVRLKKSLQPRLKKITHKIILLETARNLHLANETTLAKELKNEEKALNVFLEKKYHAPERKLRKKYSRKAENFAGKLPKNPFTPNCVNSQQKSFWGKLYNVDPISVPPSLVDPIGTMKALFQNTHRENFNSDNVKLFEEKGNYLHYTYTVVIPKGVLKGTYTDDVDLYYNAEKHIFDVRSASRKGFRDGLNLKIKTVPGANKKRVEAIRAEFAKLTQ